MRKLFNSLIAKFLLVSCPVFILFVTLGFFAYQSYRSDILRSEAATQVAVEIHNLSRFISTDLRKHDGRNIRDILSRLRGGRLIICAKFSNGNDISVGWPFPGCQTIGDGLQGINSPVKDKKKQLGVLEVGYSLDWTNENLTKEMGILTTVLVSSGILAFFSCLLGYFIVVGQPVQILIQAMSQRTETGENVYAELRSSDELGRIAKAYNRLVDHEEKRLAEIQAVNEQLTSEIQERTKAEENLKEAHAQLLQTSKMEAIGTLSAGVAHELNTPIQFISTNLQFLKEGISEIQSVFRKIMTENGSELPQSIQDLIEECDLEFTLEEMPAAIDESKKGTNTISNIVGAMQTMTSTDNEECSLIDLGMLISNTVTLTGNEWRTKVDIETDIDPDLPKFNGYQSALSQVILNLIMNAVQAIEAKEDSEKGVIKISATSMDQSIRISVRDNGIGIPEEHIPRIFDMFYTTKPVGKGTGQGLAVCQTIICGSHNGNFDVTSEPNQGTTFNITLPTDQNKAAA